MIKWRPLRPFGSNLAKWQTVLRAPAQSSAFSQKAGNQSSPLQEGFAFGSNPGKLRMFTYRPKVLAHRPALVVVLHGCTQTAAGYNEGAGWSSLADRYGFALLLPEQQRTNNPNGCFNWFLPEHSRRDQGEALSIRQMIEKSVRDFGMDRQRIFVTGLSAGGAMTSIMLACYPDVFAGGAIIAGLPYGAANNVQQAFKSMYQSPSRTPREWGNLVRDASPHKGHWPRVSVWHGDADQTVIPSNARELLKQWTDVHGLPLSPSLKARVDGYPREIWLSEAGEELLESYTIPNMAHGTPLATDESEGACGAPGRFLLPVGISSSYHIAKFFGIVPAVSSSKPSVSSSKDVKPYSAPAERVLEGEILSKDELPRSPPRANHPGSIGAVINDALRAAGLIKH
jgi:poly(hydroxyalkanoate) depolymerase family esterase